jgi:hypothetical protein
MVRFLCILAMLYIPPCNAQYCADNACEDLLLDGKKAGWKGDCQVENNNRLVFQKSRDGLSFVRLKLTYSLLAGQKYRLHSVFHVEHQQEIHSVEFFVNVTKDVGVATAFYPQVQNYPRDDTDTFQVSGSFVARGSEQYLFAKVKYQDGLFYDGSSSDENAALILDSISFGVVASESSQNLILNGGFEDYFSIPSSDLSSMPESAFWNSYPYNGKGDREFYIEYGSGSMHAFSGLLTVLGSADFYTPLNHDSLLDMLETPQTSPFSGGAFAGINVVSFVPNRDLRRLESVSQKLHCQLIKGEMYEVSVAVKVDSSSAYESNALGVYFSECPDVFEESSECGVRVFTFTDSVISSFSWEVHRVRFIASGKERYITVGDSNRSDLIKKRINRGVTCYHLLDEITLYKVSSDP